MDYLVRDRWGTGNSCMMLTSFPRHNALLWRCELKWRKVNLTKCIKIWDYSRRVCGFVAEWSSKQDDKMHNRCLKSSSGITNQTVIIILNLLLCFYFVAWHHTAPLAAYYIMDYTFMRIIIWWYYIGLCCSASKLYPSWIQGYGATKANGRLLDYILQSAIPPGPTACRSDCNDPSPLQTLPCTPSWVSNTAHWLYSDALWEYWTSVSWDIDVNSCLYLQ